MESVSQENFSRQLYSFLCKEIGSEQVVRWRRIFYQIMDDSSNFKNKVLTQMCSGSKAEGLDMSGSDIDFILVLDMCPVFNMTENDNRCDGLSIDTEHAPPGFVYLTNVSCISLNDMIFTLTEHGMVLSSEHFIDFLKSKHCFNVDCKKHGPCLSISFLIEIDLAYCLKSETWPAIAQKWLRRPHNSGWPSSSNLKILAAEALLYVPIGKKSGVKVSNPLQWRISFSIQEKLLVFSFNHTQLLCYALLKLILKEYINTQTQVSDLLCSYFMKTTMFWVSEEVRISEWKPENLFRCFQSCIKRLIYFVTLGYCPNYFIPENNMFEGKICGRKQKELLFVLESLNAGHKNFISKIPTLRHFDLDENYFYNNVLQNEIDIAIYPLLNRYFWFPKPIPSSSCSFLSLILTKIENQSSNLCKSLYFKWLAHFYSQALTKMPYKWQCKNKYFYQQYKQFRFYVFISRNIDTVSGWLLLAIFMYQHGNYKSTLELTSHILQECTPDKTYIYYTNSTRIDNDILAACYLSFLQRHKICCIYQLIYNCEAQSIFFKTDLGFLCNSRGDQTDEGAKREVSVIFAPPIVFLHFVRFMCFHHVGNIFERNKCLKDIVLTVEEDFFIDSGLQRVIANIYLVQALKIVNDKRFETLIDEIQHKMFIEGLKLPFIREHKFSPDIERYLDWFCSENTL